jgi:hypothetical protein
MNEDRHPEPGLFDLPLEAPPPPPGAPGASASGQGYGRRPAPPETLPLFSEEEVEQVLAERLAEPPREHPPRIVESPRRTRPIAVPATAPDPPAARLLPRLRADLADLAILGAATLLAAVGALLLRAPVGLDQLPALALFLLAFSFLYVVVPLAFWGATPGMSWSGVVARTTPAEPLSFGQTTRRWLATWITWLLAGLPGLLALGGRSFADRLSGSRTYLRADVASR